MIYVGASAELIAVSSILTFDIYKTYIRPAATPTQLITVSHVMICVFGITMAFFASILNVVGVDLGWLFLVMGLLIGGAIFPVAFSICWKGQSKAGAVAGSVTGLCAGLLAWLVTAKRVYGTLSVATTGMEYPTLAGNLAAVLTGLVVSTSISLARPEAFEWETTRAINAPSMTVSAPESSDGEKGRESRGSATLTDAEIQVQQDPTVSEDQASLHHAFKIACIATVAITFVIVFLVPIPMFLSHYVFSEGFFVAWVILTFIWVFASTGISCLLPIWETRTFFQRLLSDVFHGNKNPRA